jgi:hypothetical protein
MALVLRPGYTIHPICPGSQWLIMQLKNPQPVRMEDLFLDPSGKGNPACARIYWQPETPVPHKEEKEKKG